MENKIHFIERLFERIEEYGKTSYELLKLKAVDKTTEVVSTFVSRVYFVFFLSMFIVFVSIGAALLLRELLGKSYYGFFCVAGFYGIVGCIIYIFLNNWIKKCVGDSFISQMLN